MSNSNNQNTKKDFWGKIRTQLTILTEKIRACDRYTLICLITGAVFFVLATVQLGLIVFTPVTSTFDQISVIILDYTIVAFCAVFLLYRLGRMEHLLPSGIKENLLPQGQDTDSRHKAGHETPEVAANHPRKSTPDFIGIGHMNSSSDRGNGQRRSGNRTYFDESMISPGHRYSSDNVQERRPAASQNSARRRESSHVPNGIQSPRFSSHGVKD